MQCIMCSQKDSWYAYYMMFYILFYKSSTQYIQEKIHGMHTTYYFTCYFIKVCSICLFTNIQMYAHCILFHMLFCKNSVQRIIAKIVGMHTACCYTYYFKNSMECIMYIQSNLDGMHTTYCFTCCFIKVSSISCTFTHIQIYVYCILFYIQFI